MCDKDFDQFQAFRFPDLSSTSLGETAWATRVQSFVPPQLCISLVALEEPPDPLGLCFAISKMEGLGPESLRSFEPSCLSAFLAGPSRKRKEVEGKEGAGNEPL